MFIAVTQYTGHSIFKNLLKCNCMCVRIILLYFMNLIDMFMRKLFYCIRPR